ncbi:MAG: TonB-dependent siderophore receptor [Sphingorhabdus sp.]|uniref:TonB-dependent receptor n=1 Tax=Sphingorhabdus sp. TaxID=1902408 RepID=UPI0025E3ADF3|nr:TonB-dependent siderophore receptor [Sphingorhabdus sp.]MCO4090960.1 TonB-dependent siderophore receptor [Sphingorhabdus sp.]
MLRLSASIIAVLSASAFWQPAFAEEAFDVEAYDDSRTIIVTGLSEGYLATNSVTATKTDTPLIDIPQTINVVTREQLDDQAHHSLADILRYVPGTTVGQGEGNRDQITLRGQNTTADFFLDGVRDDVQYYRGLYNIERVEILKGPYALIFGRGGGGGIINRVQKSPLSDDFVYAGQASINSLGAYDLSADVNAPLSDAVAVRINAVYENFDSHRDFVGGARYAWNPYVAFKLNDAWKLGLSYEYVHDDRTTDRGIPSIANGAGQPNRPIAGYRDQFFGVPGVNYTKLEAQIAKLRLDGALTSNLSFSGTILYGDYDKTYLNVYPNGAATAQSGTVALAAYSDPTQRENFIAQANLVWAVETGPLMHKILVGTEYGDQKSANRRFNGALSNATFNLANPIFPTVSFNTLSRDTVSDVTFFSAYVQDQISFGDHIDVVAGLRYDNFDIDGTDLFPVVDRHFARKDEKVSPRLGLIFKPQENISVYGSYSQSFLPRSGDQFLALTVTQQNLAPEKFTNYEIGAKWDVQPNLNLTLAVFQLERSNATTPDPRNPVVSINIGTTRTQGIELAVTGNITSSWQVHGGYSYQDATLAGNESVRLGQVPRHQASLWNRYDFNDRFAAGLGIIHQSSQFAAIRTAPNTTKLPAFTRVDAAFYYDLSDALQLQLNVENLFDTDYYSDAHNNNNISTGAPINGRFTIRAKF